MKNVVLIILVIAAVCISSVMLNPESQTNNNTNKSSVSRKSNTPNTIYIMGKSLKLNGNEECSTVTRVCFANYQSGNIKYMDGNQPIISKINFVVGEKDGSLWTSRKEIEDYLSKSRNAFGNSKFGGIIQYDNKNFILYFTYVDSRGVKKLTVEKYRSVSQEYGMQIVQNRYQTIITSEQYNEVAIRNIVQAFAKEKFIRINRSKAKKTSEIFYL